MSGIAGVIHFDGRPVETGLVESMTDAMRYRGPDGISHWRRDNVALGHCMLRTTPESLAERQPLTNEDESLVLVMDGRIDNWEELRRDLLGKGAVLRTRADAELVLRSFEIWGHDCVRHIDGDFALVIWDGRRREVFSARDRMGNKPFTWYWAGKTLYFASEQQAILNQKSVVKAVNEDVLAEYLSAEWLSRTETLWNDVFRLEPAHAMVVTETGSRFSRYWSPDLEIDLACRSDQACIEQYRALLFDVVRRLSRSQRPVAFEVSGGLDSSAIFAVAADLKRQGLLCAPEMNGFTLDFRGDPDADETDYCRAVGAHVGRSIREVLPAHPPISWYQETACHFMDIAGFPNGVMGQSISHLAAAGGHRVLLNGIGGDQWLSGSELSYAEALSGWRGNELLELLVNDLRSEGIQSTVVRLLRFGVIPLLSLRNQRLLRGAYARLRRRERTGEPLWLTAPMRARLEERREAFSQKAAVDGGPRLQRQQLAFLNDAYQQLANEMNERLAALAGLEMRQPFWNSRMVEFALATPGRLRRRAGEDKWMHRRAMTGLMPQKVLQRSSKAEFSVTFANYWADLAALLEEGVVTRREHWVDPQRIRQMLETFQNSIGPGQTGSARWALWALLAVDSAVGLDDCLKGCA